MSQPDQIQARLLRLAFLFLIFYAAALTLAPLVRERNLDAELPWQHWIGIGIWALVTGILHRQSALSLPDRDPFLLPIGAILSGWGLLTIYRLSTVLGLRQTVWLAIAGALLWLAMRKKIRLPVLQQYKYVWLTSGLSLTALTLIFGTNPLGYGPRLWLGCCGIYFQPSELLKLLLTIYLAAYLSDRQLLLRALTTYTSQPSRSMASALFPVLAPTLLMTGLALAITIMQRDLGTASIFLFLYACMVYLSVQRKLVVWLSLGALFLSGVSSYLLFDVVRNRIDTWWNPWLDPSGSSYQIVQSVIAIANGGVLGRGPGMGYPGLVPVAHSDFIFTAVAEETGLIGSLGLLMAAGLLAQRGIRTALHAPDLFQRLISGGLSAYLVGQTVLIIGGNLRLLPLTGVTLPFFSYGGSSLVTSYLALLIILLVSNQSEEAPLVPFDTRPYQELFGVLIIGLTASGLMTGWWSLLRSENLLSRTDNPRRSIADRFVPRGNLLDRNGSPLTENLGEVGSFRRRYLAPELGPVLGYTHPVYGQAGLEASLDPWLRGLRDTSPWTSFSSLLLYGQPPPGLDLRLTISLELQKTAARLFASQPAGAVVIMELASGDLLTVFSQPWFDPNRLDQDWEVLIQDPYAPFLNRATQGLYPPGASLIPLLLAKAAESITNITIPTTTEDDSTCAIPPGAYPGFNSASAGCGSLARQLGKLIPPEELLDFYRQLGFYSPPEAYFNALSSEEPSAIETSEETAIGMTTPILRISPLQMAIAAGTLNAAGTKPAPRILLAVNIPEAGWVNQTPLQEPLPVLLPSAVEKAIQTLKDPRLPVWRVLAIGEEKSSLAPAVTWLVSGTLAPWDGNSMVMVIVLEKNDPQSALQIEQELWNVLLNPEK